MMKKIRKLVAVILVVALIIPLSGCSGGNSGSSGGKTKLTFALWDQGQREGMEKIAEAYMAKNPDVEIEVQVTSWNEYWTKLEAGIQSGTAPDVFWMHPNQILDYADAGVLASCEDIVNTSNFPETALTNCKSSDGTLYGVPKDKDTVGLVYNKELFDEAGVAYPDENWTWDDLNEASAKIYEKTGKYGFLAYADEQLGYWNFVYQAGGYIVNDARDRAGFDDPKTQEAMKFYIEIQDNDWCPDQNYFAQNSPGDTFFSGNGAMYIEGSWNMLAECQNYPEMAGKWDVAVLPKYPTPEEGEDGRATISNSLCYSTAADGANKEEALKFMEFLGTEEAQRIQGETGTAIPAYNGLEETWVDFFKEAGYDIDVQKFIDMFAYGVASPNDKSRPAWKTSVNSTLLQIYAKQIGYDEGFATMQSLVDSAMEGY